MIITAATLGVIVESGENVLTLIEGIEAAEFAASRLTRHEVRRQLRAIASALDGLPADAQRALPEIDWPGWRGAAAALQETAAGSDETAWFAARSLVPATLMWLQVYRRSDPALFEFRP